GARHVLGSRVVRLRRLFVFFFFQAEDGIRDRNVTGVQTCALPISSGRAESLIPKVGQRGTSPSGRSNTETGKFDSSPPSTSTAGLPSAVLQRTGRKNTGIEVEARTVSATRSRPGVVPKTSASVGRCRRRPAERSEAVTTRRYFRAPAGWCAGSGSW